MSNQGEWDNGIHDNEDGNAENEAYSELPWEQRGPWHENEFPNPLRDNDDTELFSGV